MVVRNPYERAKSLWLHWRRFVDEQCEFETFMRGEIDDWFYAWRLVNFADAVVVRSTGEAKSVDEVIRLERLRTDLRRLGLVAMVRNENVGERMIVGLSEPAKVVVAKWAKSVFGKFA
jgi:hypothetical protein